MSPCRVLPAVVALSLALACCRAQPTDYARRRLPAVRTATPPAIDGDLSDAAWSAAAAAEPFIDRLTGRPAADQTAARILYDDACIYISLHARDSRPEAVIGRETVRDSHYNGPDNGEDSLEVMIDPFRSFRWPDQSRFALNPLGTRSARIGGGRAGKAEWKGDWAGAARRVADGWTAEMRIPWEVLNYPSSAAPVAMGINFRRFQYRTQIASEWSDTGPQGFPERAGVWEGVAVPRGGFAPTLSALPYVLGGLRHVSPTLRAGADLRYTLTPQMTAVGTVNPDFSTIEGAVEGIQFSRSERYIPEHRPFFLEGGDYFGAGAEWAIGSYFYPQRIEQFDVGAKLYGKPSPSSALGLLHALDIGRRSDLVAQYRHDFTPTSGAGLFLVNRAARHDDNTVAVVTQGSRWGKLGLSTELAQSAGVGAGGGAVRANVTFEDKRGFTSLQLLEVARNFRAADGYIPYVDYRGLSLYQNWYNEWRHGPVRGFSLECGSTCDWHIDGRPFRRGGSIDLGLDTRSDWFYSIDAYYQSFDDQVDCVYGLTVRQGARNRFRQWRFRVEAGRLGGRPSTYFGPSFSVRTLRRLDLAYGGALLVLDGHTQQHVLTLAYEISPTRSVGGRLVVEGGDTNWYLSYRRSGERGTEMYVMLGDPNTARFTQRVAVKMVTAL
ncbi:MAG: hypothetical protein IT208_04655 [Chthonomonadales bacterium]|nr:hypothetical protein [Chthonomonadales bacterium]